MTQRELYSQLTSRTGDDLDTISRLGFSVEEPNVAVLDPEPNHHRPNVVDWDKLAAARN